MKCPHCNHDFPLTWKRYFSSPLGKHLCPVCSRGSRLQFRLPQFFVMISAMAIVATPFAVLLYRWLGGYWPVLGVVPGMVAVLPLDKMLDERYRSLIATKDKVHEIT